MHDTRHQCRGGNRTARLNDDLESIEQVTHRSRERCVIHENNVVDVRLMVMERHVADLCRLESICESAR